MLLRLTIGCALLVPAVAYAQSRPAQPVTVEIVSTGEIDTAPTSVTLNVNFLAHGETNAQAEAAKAAKLAEMLRTLQAQGVPATAITALPPEDLSRLVTNAATTEDATEVDDSDDDAKSDAKAAKVEKADVVVGDGRTVRLTSLAQAETVRAALEKIDVTASEPVASLDNRDAVARQAKTKALRSARLDADAYAAEMGMHVVRVARISESGGNMVLPGLQEKLQRAVTGGPTALKDLFKDKPGLVHVEATIIAEFVLAP
jgi:uncharacterized protein